MRIPRWRFPETKIVHLKALDNNRYIIMGISLLERRRNIVRRGEERTNFRKIPKGEGANYIRYNDNKNAITSRNNF